MTEHPYVYLLLKVDALETENKRLREALERISDDDHEKVCLEHADDIDSCLCHEEIAKAALERPDGK